MRADLHEDVSFPVSPENAEVSLVEVTSVGICEANSYPVCKKRSPVLVYNRWLNESIEEPNLTGLF